jgi:hypothetical protein
MKAAPPVEVFNCFHKEYTFLFLFYQGKNYIHVVYFPIGNISHISIIIVKIEIWAFNIIKEGFLLS